MKKYVAVSLMIVCIAAAMVAEAVPVRPARGPAGTRMERARSGAARARGERQHSRGQMLEGLLRNPEKAAEFGISEKQLEQCRDLQYAFERQQVELRARAELARMELRRLMRQDDVDRKAVIAASDEAREIQGKLARLALEYRLDLRETLGAETLERLRAEVRERVRKHARAGRAGSRREGRERAGRAMRRGPPERPQQEQKD